METLEAFLRDSLFHEMMLATDRARGLWSLQLLEEPEAVADAPVAGAQGSLVREGFGMSLAPLDTPGLAARLRWMLTRAPSPYCRHLDDEHARDLVNGFLRQVFGPGGHSPPTGPGGPAGTTTPWEYYALRPDFLKAIDEGTEEPFQPTYFEGRTTDTATLFYRYEVFYLLLTNGAP